MTARAWQRMLSGRRLDLLDPSPLDIEIEDIAHGLAFVARWNGQTRGDQPFSVAEHSLLVEEIFARLSPGGAPPARWRLAALLHDAPEYVIGDMISPFKAALGLDYREFEERLARAVRIRFGLPAALPAAVAQRIKRADRASAWLEAVQLAGFDEREAGRHFRRPRFSGWQEMRLAPLPAAEARAAFLARFETLSAALSPAPAGGAGAPAARRPKRPRP
jgi:5'-deoxynucleotidase YfbR-like HD superfamily hydrolase